MGRIVASLDPEKIRDTARLLEQRVEERFPGAGLCRVAEQLTAVAKQAAARSVEIRQPNVWLRVICWSVIGLMVFALITGIALVDYTFDEFTMQTLLEIIEMGIQDLLFIGAAFFFLITFENRFKRNKVLEAVHELRTLAHLIDVHQLTKNPEAVGDHSRDTEHSPARNYDKFLMGRYLDYCSEMLSLCGKIAAVYVDGFHDSEAVRAAGDYETLVTGLSRKIWQKIIILEQQEE